jgi:peptidoglycan/LPS O-acetylase OafA/YrhL
VRGLAILLVLLFHTAQLDLLHGPLDVALTAIPALGWTGVDLFFVLSGFLITNILLATRAGPTYARSFYARRTLRIFPLYYVVLTFFLVIAPRLPFLATLNAVWSGDIHANPLWYWFYLSNWRVAWSGAWDHRSLSVAWSLAIEEQFYLIWPWVVRRGSERGLFRLCVAILVAAFLLRVGFVLSPASWLVPYVLTPCRLDTLATGAAIALLARQPGGLAPLAPYARRLLAGASVLFFGLVTYLRVQIAGDPPSILELSLAWEPLMQTVGFSALCLLLGSGLVVVIIAPADSRLARVFEAGVLCSLGRYSYACYLLHLPVAMAIGLWFPRAALVQHFVLSQCVFWVLAIGVVYALARLSWLVIESPFLRLKRYVPYRS